MSSITIEHHVTPAKLDVLYVDDWPVWEKGVSEFDWTYDKKETCYIVEGKGQESSFTSCSHGAGRKMSRSKARKTLDIDGLRKQMDGKVWNDRDAGRLLDEDPRAYKDIDQVMADQEDLVTIRHTLSQILNYKGA